MGKILTFIKEKRNTMLFRIAFINILVNFIMMILIGAIVIAIVSSQFYQQIKSEVDFIYEMLRKDGVEQIHKLAPADQDEIFIKITNPNGETIQSENMEQLGRETVVSSRLFLGPILNFGNSDDSYYKSIYEEDGYQIEIFVNIEDNLEVVEFIIKTIILVAGVGLVGAMLVIYEMSKRINRPLATMTKEIHSEQLEVTVPNSPQELNELAQAFNHLGDMLEEKITRERQFISDASHELRTPLSAIRGHLNLIKRRGESHPEIVDPSLEFIDQESLRMQRLIEQLLMISRLEHDSQELPQINLSNLLKSIVNDYPFIFEQTFTHEIEEKIIIKGNRDQIQQVVISLLENAHKYTPKEGEIKLILKCEGDMSVIEVKDNGPGIAEEEKKKIFERFYRVDPSRSSQVSGAGLGLAITKQLVTLNEGTIEVRDNELTGSIFILKFAVHNENT